MFAILPNNDIIYGLTSDYYIYLKPKVLKFFLPVILALVILSCENTLDKKTKDFSIEKTFVPIQFPQISDYYIYCISQFRGKQGLITYNHLVHSLDIFDISQEKFLKSIPLNREGPEAISEIIGIGTLDTAKIVIATNNNIYFFDLNTEHYFRSISINGANHSLHTTDLSQNVVLFPGNRNRLYVSDNCVYLTTFHLPIQANLDKPLLAKINLTNLTVETLPIFFPRWSFKNRNYGMLYEIFFIPTRNGIIYNFPFSDSIYLYNERLQTTRTFKIPSKYIPESANPIYTPAVAYSQKDYIKHKSESLQYLDVNTWEEKEIFLRFQTPPLENDNTHYTFYLSIFNEKMEVLHEMVMKNNESVRSFIANNCLWIFNRSQNEEKLEFTKLCYH